jgi:hypothetical protein
MSNKTDTKLTFAAITAMPRGERYTLFRDNVVKPFGAITKAKDAATEKMHMAFKVTASLKRDYAAMLHGKEIAPDMTEAKFFAQYCGGDVPARVKQLATFFNAVVLTGAKPLIPEAFVDAASVNSLEKAASIIATERKNCADAWMATDITLDVINALSTPGDATKKLAEIRKRQNPKADDEGSAETPTSALVSLLLNRIAEAKDDEEGFKLFCFGQDLAERWGQNKQIPATRYAEWLATREKNSKPQLTHGNDGAPAPDAEDASADKNAEAEAAELEAAGATN